MQTLTARQVPPAFVPGAPARHQQPAGGWGWQASSLVREIRSDHMKRFYALSFALAAHASMAAPSGSYSGIAGLGNTGNVTISVYPNIDGSLDFSASGAFYIECSGPTKEQ